MRLSSYALATPTALAVACGMGLSGASAQVEFYFTADNGDTLRQGAAGTTIATLPAGNPADVDVLGSTLYYSDFTQDRFYSVPTLGGTATEVLNVSGIATNPTVINLAVGGGGSTFHFGEGLTDSIYRSVGGVITQIVDLNAEFGAGTYNPRGVTLDEAGGKVYWADSSTDSIYRANLDGSSAELLADLTSLSASNISPNALALDLAGGKVYIADNADFLAVADLDGSNASVLVNLDDSGYLGGETTWSLEDIEFFNNRLYVADTSNGIFSVSALDGGSFVSNFGTDVDARGVAVIPEPATGLVLLGLLAVATRRRRVA